MSGITYSIACPHCGKIYEFDFGATTLYNPVSLFVSSLEHNGKPLIDYLVSSKKIKEETLKLAHSGYGLDFDYQHTIYYCEKCQRAYSRFYYHLSMIDHDGAKLTYEPPYKCCRCHKPLVKKLEKDCQNLTIKCKCGECFKLNLSSDLEPLTWQ